MFGIGYHHAGLDLQDRKIIEDLFSTGDLPVLSKILMNYFSYLKEEDEK